MSAINVNSITGRTGTHGPVLTGVTTATNGLNVTGGSLLVGTTTEGYATYADNLTIADSDNCGITIRSGTSSQGNIYFSDGSSGGSEEYEGIIQYFHDVDAMAFGVNNGTEQIRIDSSGRVLIGTATAPTVTVTSSALLVVEGYVGVPTGDALISLQRGQAPASISSGAQVGGINFGANDGSRYAQIHVNSDGASGTNDYPGRIVFSTTADGASSPTERLRIDNAGRLLIGTTVNTGYFGASAVTSIVDQGGFKIPLALETFRNDASGCYLVLSHSRSTTPGNYTALQNGDELGRISFNGADGVDLTSAGANIRAAVDGTPVSENNMPGRLIFSTSSFGANIPTERMHINSSGTIVLPDASPGIQFGTFSAPVTSTSLDDYEEGTFTATVAGSTTPGTATYAYQLGDYTKIGRMVHIRVYVSWTGHTGAGGLYVRGLPYNIVNYASYGGPAVNYWNQMNPGACNGISAIWGIGSDYVYFYTNSVSGGAATSIPVQPAGSIIIGGAYYV